MKDKHFPYLTLLTYLFTFQVVAFSTFQEIGNGMKILDIDYFPSLFAVTAQNITSLTSHFFYLDTDSLSFQEIATIPNNFEVDGYKSNTLAQNYFVVYDSLTYYDCRGQNFTNLQTISINSKYLGPVFSLNGLSAFYLKITGTQPSLMLQIFSIDNFVGAGPSAVMGAIYPEVREFISNQDKLYLHYISSPNLYIEIFDQSSFSSPSQTLIVPTSALTSSLKFFSDLLLICLDSSMIIIESITGGFTETDRIEIGVGALANISGLIIDFFIMDNTLVFTTDLMKLHKYDMSSKQVLDSTTTPALMLSEFNTTHFAIWNSGDNIFYLTSLASESEVIETPQNSTEALTFLQQLRQNWKVADSIVLGKSLVMSSMKSIFKLLVPVISFLEQFWLYKYHTETYPQFFQLFTQEVDIINYYRLLPPFEIEIPKQYLQWAEEKNVLYQESSHLEKSESAPENICFLMSLPNFIANVVMNISMYLICWIVLLIVMMLGRFFESFKKLQKIGLDKLRPMSLLVAILDSNLLIMVYYLCFQIVRNFSFSMTDKSVLAGVSLLGFLFFFYSCSGYLFLKISDRTTAQNSLAFSKFSNRGLTVEMIILLTVKCGKAIVHSLLISHYEAQIISLCLFDLLALIAILYYREGFISYLFFSAYLSYYIILFIVNCTFFIKYKFYRTDQNFEQICSIIVIIALLLLVLITLIKILLTLHQEMSECLVFIYNHLFGQKKEKQNQILNADNIFENIEENTDKNEPKLEKIANMKKNTVKCQRREEDKKQKLQKVGVMRCQIKKKKGDKMKQIELQIVMKEQASNQTVSEYQLTNIFSKMKQIKDQNHLTNF